jgi:regulatory protein
MNPIKNKKDLDESIEEIRNFAYSYLEKYSPSKQQLRTFLFKKFIKKKQKISSKKEIFDLIDSIISSLVDQKLLSDRYYSDAKSKAFLRKGYSLNKIRYSLIKKGIDEKYIKASISKIKENESDPDFFSAIKICKRRRIGPTREESNRPLFYKKDISILARSGFSYEISKKVLEIPKEEFKKFCKML